MSDTAVDIAGLDKQNGVTLGRILGRGTVGQAEEGPDGVMRATIRIPEDELVYEPGILVMPHAGTLELTLINDDKNTHCAVLPSNGDYKFIWLVNHSKGTATLELDGPGYYWYGSRSGNDEGRGLTAAIVVGGDAPPEARIDRPPQPPLIPLPVQPGVAVRVSVYTSPGPDQPTCAGPATSGTIKATLSNLN